MRTINRRISCCFLGIIVAFFSALPVNAEPIGFNLQTKDFTYPGVLFREGDYHRTISEILKLKFDHHAEIGLDLNLLLLQSYFYLHEHLEVIQLSKSLLDQSQTLERNSDRYSVGKYLTASLIFTDNQDKAEQAWNYYCYPYSGESFPGTETLPGKIDPNKARIYSAILPGSGMLLSKEYSKAAVSLLLNIAFVAGIYHYASDNQYGIAGVLTFFELGWYFGGQNAAYEAAEQYNNIHILGFQKSWITNKLN